MYDRRIAALILGLAALLPTTGCKSGNVLAPSEGQIVLTANPVTVRLDPGADPPIISADTTITAQLFDSSGFALQGIDVIFTADAGTLASAAPPGSPPNSIETDENGFAIDVLTVDTGDPGTIEVSARTGTLLQTVTVTKLDASLNQAPTAFIVASPSGSQLGGLEVTFDGSGSSDPEGDPITCYQWEIAAAPDPTEIVQGRSQTEIRRTYGDKCDDSENRTLTVRLRVSDDPAIACQPAGPIEDVSLFSPIGDVVFNYRVEADITPPVANAGMDQTVVLGAGPSVSVSLNGILSFDEDTSIVDFSWDCKNNLQTPSGAQVDCDYTTQGIFNVELTVTDECNRTDTDIVTITVN